MRNIEARRQSDGQTIADRLINDFKHPPTMTVTDHNGTVHVYPYKGYTSNELAYYLNFGNGVRARSRVINAMRYAAKYAESKGYYIPCGSRVRRYKATDDPDSIRLDGDYCAKQEHTWGKKKKQHYAWADAHESVPAASDTQTVAGHEK